jgi:hypothetical protein
MQEIAEATAYLPAMRLEDHVFASGGSATVSFTPPAMGRWRAKASHAGSRTASPSAPGFSYPLVSEG